MAASTRARDVPLTGPPLSTRDTVLAPTPAWLATSAIVAALLRSMVRDSPRRLDAVVTKSYLRAAGVEALPRAGGAASAVGTGARRRACAARDPPCRHARPRRPVAADRS